MRTRNRSSWYDDMAGLRFLCHKVRLREPDLMPVESGGGGEENLNFDGAVGFQDHAPANLPAPVERRTAPSGAVSVSRRWDRCRACVRLRASTQPLTVIQCLASQSPLHAQGDKNVRGRHQKISFRHPGLLQLPVAAAAARQG